MCFLLCICYSSGAVYTSQFNYSSQMRYFCCFDPLPPDFVIVEHIQCMYHGFSLLTQKEVIVFACNGCLRLLSYAFCLVQTVPFCTRITLYTMLSRRCYENIQPPASHWDGPSFKCNLHFQQGQQVAVFRIWIRMNFFINKNRDFYLLFFKHWPVDYLVSASV